MINWEAASAIGQIVGALAVVISLAYLGVQIRQNSAVLRAANSHNLAETALTFSATLGSQAGLAYLFNRGLAMDPLLTKEEQAQVAYLFHAWLRILENGHYQVSSGFLDEELWEGWCETARSLLGTPGGRRLWETARPRVRQDFRRFIDKEILPASTDKAADNFLNPFSIDNADH